MFNNILLNICYSRWCVVDNNVNIDVILIVVVVFYRKPLRTCKTHSNKRSKYTHTNTPK